MIEYLADIKAKSGLKLTALIKMLGITKSKYYDWKSRAGLVNKHNGPIPKRHWLTPLESAAIADFARSYIGGYQYYIRDGYRRIAYMGMDAGKFACSASSVYRVLKQEGMLTKWNKKHTREKGKGFTQPVKPHEHWLHSSLYYLRP